MTSGGAVCGENTHTHTHTHTVNINTHSEHKHTAKRERERERERKNIIVCNHVLWHPAPHSWARAGLRCRVGRRIPPHPLTGHREHHFSLPNQREGEHLAGGRAKPGSRLIKSRRAEDREEAGREREAWRKHLRPRITQRLRETLKTLVVFPVVD